MTSLYSKLRYYFWLLKQRRGRTFFLIGTPVHENIGDAAIAFAEIKFLKDVLPNGTSIIEIDQNIMCEYIDVIKRVVRKKDVVLFHGGGNMGDEWVKEEQNRRNVMLALKKSKMIILPQTVFYKNNDNLLEASRFYDQFKNLCIFAREKESFEVLLRSFCNKIFLVPDMVLYLKTKKVAVSKGKRNGCLLCFRNDNEIRLSNTEKEIIEKVLNENGIKYSFTDMISDTGIISSERKRVIDLKLKEFSEAELVITDRLHGMVFCYLTNTPCIVFSNYNHKVIGTYKWIEQASNIEVGRSNEIEEQIKRMLSHKSAQQEPVVEIEMYKELCQEMEIK